MFSQLGTKIKEVVEFRYGKEKNYMSDTERVSFTVIYKQLN